MNLEGLSHPLSLLLLPLQIPLNSGHFPIVYSGMRTYSLKAILFQNVYYSDILLYLCLVLFVYKIITFSFQYTLYALTKYYITYHALYIDFNVTYFLFFDRQEKYNLEKKYEETYSMLKIKENQILVLQTEVSY